MDLDRFSTALLDVIIDYERGALNEYEALTATIDVLRIHDGVVNQDPDPAVGQALFEIGDDLPEPELFSIGVPLTLAALAASGDDYDRCRYECYVNGAEAALLDCYFDEDSRYMDVLAASFPHQLYTLARPLIARILYPYQTDSLR